MRESVKQALAGVLIGAAMAGIFFMGDRFEYQKEQQLKNTSQYQH
ncbi:hypothetical protein FDI69_gp151 [Rhodococcus phage Trina]|uniref:Uncharacterized protein n=1 Tax=Rhodococcus phage Trina TaxID=2027905 RepID=A0A2D0ZMB6_9CAUD|nr:hypothetical protein FDI69_gp151 [Rhodococcus phage Trina]ASZ75035.1 hypothetical protein SEA_TRINA_256 [Rhodococcus phage Trina]